MLSNGETLAARYRIVRKLNEGGMGAVYEATDTRLNARVAIKENLFEEERRKAAFRREAQLLANLSHPALPGVIDYFVEGGGQYLVMEFVEGDDLTQVLARCETPLPAGVVLGWADQLLRVLDYLHSQPTPVVHRDIKPHNIKVVDGRLFLLDFGLAHGQSGDMSTYLSSQFSWDGSSTSYSPLEQLRSQPTTPAGDVYSFAATLYTLLVGRAPEHAEHRFQMMLLGKPDPLKEIGLLRPDLDRNVARALMLALDLDMSRRPQNAKEMLRVMFTPASVKRVRARSRGRVAMLCAAVALSLCALGALAVAGARPALCRNRPNDFLSQTLRCPAEEYAPVAAPEAVPVKVEAGERKVRQLLDEAETSLQGAHYEEALHKAREALSLSPNNVYALAFEGDVLWDTSDESVESVEQLPEVQERADKILGLVLSPQTWEEYAARSWANLAKGKSDIAIADAGKALQLKPDCVVALMVRATARSATTATDNKLALDSLADYNEVIRLRPNYAQAYANRAATYAALGQFKLAVSDYTEASRLRPRAVYHVGCGDAQFNLEEYDGARREYEAAIRLNPKLYRAHVGLADVQLQEEDWGNAVKEYNTAVKLQPTAYAFNKRGYCFTQLKEFGKAIQDFTAALGLDPSDFGSHVARAFAYTQLEAWDKAIADYTRALELAPKDKGDVLGAIYRYRAQAHHQAGHERQAENDERRAQDLGQ
jgi:tetratricopeptide (TPR) repeat protein